MTKVPSDNQAMPLDKEPIPDTKPRYKSFIEHMHSWGYLCILLVVALILFFPNMVLHQCAPTDEATAKIREAVSVVEQWYYTKQKESGLTYGTILYKYVLPAIENARYITHFGPDHLKNSEVLPEDHPCIAEDIPGQGAGWVKFQNDLVITGLASGPSLVDSESTGAQPSPALNYVICIDYNGAISPNQPGQDVFIGNFNQYGAFSP